ncbi:Uncharacterised protein [Vibrio cholerae]|nr:Uncharacterised protein [Vibrio cholerae]
MLSIRATLANHRLATTLNHRTIFIQIQRLACFWLGNPEDG